MIQLLRFLACFLNWSHFGLSEKSTEKAQDLFIVLLLCNVRLCRYCGLVMLAFICPLQSSRSDASGSAGSDDDGNDLYMNESHDARGCCFKMPCVLCWATAFV